MHIRVNGNEIRELRDSQLSDVVQLLGEHMFAFKLDQAHNILDITHPIQGHQVVFESSHSELTALLSQTAKLLEETGFSVLFVKRDEDRRTVVKQLSDHYPISWITFQYEPLQEEWSASFSFEQMKWSKPLAQLLMDHLAATNEVAVRGVQLNWKNMMSSILAMSNKPIPTVLLNCGNVEPLSVFQLGQLAQSITKAMISLYTEKPIIEIIRAIRAMVYVPEAQVESVLPDAKLPLHDVEDGRKHIEAGDTLELSEVYMEPDEDCAVGREDEKKLLASASGMASIVATSSAERQIEADSEEPVTEHNVVDKTNSKPNPIPNQNQNPSPMPKKSDAPVRSDRVAEEDEAIFVPGLPRAAAGGYPKEAIKQGKSEPIQKGIDETEQAQAGTATRQRAQSNSIFSMLKAHSDAVSSTPKMGEPEAKFMSYVNQMTLAQKKEQRVVNQNRFNILTRKHNDDK
ncbi:hypothetical protein [Paenibacillus taiwanensis]|uniref:hypothetical protein n=1 Tax=Paenibacillus taiwanensis TaxID=401638 RepID=UPI0003FA00F5|nr:hypothetical protein [Paenibacillus taiwanensis]